MKIKVINPNTTWSMTHTIEQAARAAAGDNVEIVATSPSMGPFPSNRIAMRHLPQSV